MTSKARLAFGGIEVRDATGWEDITERVLVDVPDAPFTLARSADGVGVLQFSIAPYRSGRPPVVTAEVLNAWAGTSRASTDA